MSISAQTFRLETVDDSLSWLVLETDSTSDRWRLPYPVYQFHTGDISGNGIDDAMVGVVKTTRFYPEKGRRLFIFKNYHGKVRPLWMGSKLGGQLVDFRYIARKEERGARGGLIRALEATADGRYFVSDYRWEGFGMSFERFVEENINNKNIAYEKFLHDSTDGADEPVSQCTGSR